MHGFRYYRDDPKPPAADATPEQICADEIIASAPDTAPIAEESSSEDKVWGLVVQFVKAMPEHVRAEILAALGLPKTERGDNNG